ncbi:polysaccharide deacetylase family protein [Marinobacter sp. BW6]|uniref:polysaccharide deacetylase family protein n=1 Tax=Marinobacter sp. BW6 TaxID=2592624 RepID=UPI001396B944|nr:polysaccharide deacetylase family protein [Marinobacter sp. BW6]
MSIDEFSCWREGKLDIRQPSVLLTFDDAWLDNWVYAFPILQEFQANAIFFVVTSWPGDGKVRDHLLQEEAWEPKSHTVSMELAGTGRGDEVSMRWSELIAARDTGLVGIGCHSNTHGRWWNEGSSWAENLVGLKNDLEASRRAMKDKIGVCPIHWCWPKGLFSNRAFELASEYGFTSQFSTLRGSNSAGRKKLVRRFGVENKPPTWLEKRISVYGDPLLGGALGLIHQQLQGGRMAKRFKFASPGEFEFPLFKLI